MKRHRTRLGLTQPKLAAVLGVHWMSVSKWERGVQPIPEPVARLLERVVQERRARRKRAP